MFHVAPFLERPQPLVTCALDPRDRTSAWLQDFRIDCPARSWRNCLGASISTAAAGQHGVTGSSFASAANSDVRL
jgi:hypothetical protein